MGVLSGLHTKLAIKGFINNSGAILAKKN